MGEKLKKTSAFKMILSALWFVLRQPLKAVRMIGNAINDYWFSYVRLEPRYNKGRYFSVRFVHYHPAIYLYTMIFVSVLCKYLVLAGVGASTVSFIYFGLLMLSVTAVVDDTDIKKLAWYGALVLIVVLGSYFSTMQYDWNPLHHVAVHLAGLEASASPGFYHVSAYAFSLLITGFVLHAWAYRRVEFDQSYVYHRKFPFGFRRDQIFSRGIERRVKDMLEVALLMSADIVVHTAKSGRRTYSNVPFAAFGPFARAIDELVNWRSSEERKIIRDKDKESRDAEMLEEEAHRPEDVSPDEFGEDGDFDDDFEDGVDDDMDDGIDDDMDGDID